MIETLKIKIQFWQSLRESIATTNKRIKVFAQTIYSTGLWGNG